MDITSMLIQWAFLILIQPMVQIGEVMELHLDMNLQIIL